jgi:hypothetical protein
MNILPFLVGYLHIVRRSGNQNWFFTCRVHIFTDRKFKIAVCIENV